MAKNNTLKVRITGDAKDLRKATGQAQSSLKSLAGSAAKIGGMLAGAFAVREIAQFGTDLYQSGLNLEAWRVKANAVFEDQLGTVQDWADGLHVALGVTDEELVNLAASTADLLKPMGMTAKEASEMSMEVTELSGALAAWTGGTYDAAEVSGILAKAMLGEREQLKMLGVSINQAEVDQRALNLAKADGRFEITQMDKALATQQLIVEKSTDAQTAWNEGLQEQAIRANQLKVAFAELKERIASALIPVFAALFTMINAHVVPAIGMLGDFLATAKNSAVAFVRDGVDFFREWWDAYGSYFVAFKDAVVGLVERGLDLVTGWWDSNGSRILEALRVAFANVRDVVGQVTAVIEDLVSRAVTSLKNLVDNGLNLINNWWDSNGDRILGALQEAFDSVREAVRPVTDVIEDLVDTALSKLAEWFTVEGAAIEDFGDAAEFAGEKIVEWKDATVAFVNEAVQVSIDKINEWKDATVALYNEALLTVTTWVDENTGKLVFLAGAVGTLGTALLALKAYAIAVSVALAIKTAALTAATAATVAFTAAVAVITSPVFLVVGALVLLGGTLAYLYYEFETVREVVNAVMGAFIDVVLSTFNRAKDAVMGFLDVVIGFVNLFRGLFNGDVGLIMDGLKQIVSGAFEIIKSMVMSFIDALVIGWNLNPLTDHVEEVIGAIISWFASLPGEFLGLVGDIMAGAASIGSAIVDGIVSGIMAAPGAIMSALESLIPGGGLIGDAIGGIGGALSSIGVPGFADGGIVTRPTLAVVGEAGPEMIVPLTRGDQAPGAFPLPGGVGGGDVNVYVETGADPREIGASVAWALATGGA